MMTKKQSSLFIINQIRLDSQTGLTANWPPVRFKTKKKKGKTIWGVELFEPRLDLPILGTAQRSNGSSHWHAIPHFDLSPSPFISLLTTLICAHASICTVVAINVPTPRLDLATGITVLHFGNQETDQRESCVCLSLSLRH